MITSFGGGGICKINKRWWKYGAGAGVLKKGGAEWYSFYLMFLRFMVFTFRNYFILWKVVLSIVQPP